MRVRSRHCVHGTGVPSRPPPHWGVYTHGLKCERWQSSNLRSVLISRPWDTTCSTRRDSTCSTKYTGCREQVHVHPRVPSTQMRVRTPSQLFSSVHYHGNYPFSLSPPYYPTSTSKSSFLSRDRECSYLRFVDSVLTSSPPSPKNHPVHASHAEASFKPRWQ
jgi:hypothetical protein